ncbi:carboxypeptidase [bacterium (candidate division B38) B3_B38]|nr:MAG: carboxypeptidase [bacterium (candidate division B38) B3_B38]
MRRGCLSLPITLLFSFLLFSGSNLQSANPQDISIDWTHYHNYAETTDILKDFANKYKGLCKLYSIGESFQGKQIWCMEITSYASGAPETKPGMYIDGNTHAGEVSGAEACLYDVYYLLTNYGKDPLVTKLLDTKVFYIIPKINPDGSDAYLRKPGEPLDPNLKKVDDDGDELLDEDGPEDLNDDGIISLMRIRDENGPLQTSPKDARLMVQRRIDEKGEWRIIGPEGIDNDKDGRINEDPPGNARTVTNRNYPAYWAPEWIQSGSGPYPLSQPEAKVQVDFILAHPNIAGIQAHHTHSGVILRPYCNLSDEHIPPQDMRNFVAIGALGTEITGYPLMSVYHGFTRDKSNPRHGVFVDWAYDHFGAFAFTTEIWKAPGETGGSAFEEQDEELAMKWNDKELGGKGFVNWTNFNHPQFGEIEIGGWNSNFFSQNPPGKFAEAEWKKNCLFELKHAVMLPYLKIAEVKTDPLGDRLIRVTVAIENEGFLPTNVTEKAIQNKLAKPVVVKLELEEAELLCGDAKTEIGHIKGNSPPARTMFGLPGGAAPQNEKTVQWLVRVKGSRASAKITVISQKAGTASRQVSLGSP